MKIGGSLIGEVPRITRTLLELPCPVLLIPGGGPFADLVRELHAPGNESHWMAILGMEQYGWYIASQGITHSPYPEVPLKPTVLLPYRVMQNEDPLPHTWDITSDTIAAWVAYRLGLDLVILKSVDGIMEGGTFVRQVTIPFPCEEVDPELIRFALAHEVRTLIMNGKKIGPLLSLLRGEPVEGTRIGTTF